MSDLADSQNNRFNRTSGFSVTTGQNKQSQTFLAIKCVANIEIVAILFVSLWSKNTESEILWVKIITLLFKNRTPVVS